MDKPVRDCGGNTWGYIMANADPGVVCWLAATQNSFGYIKRNPQSKARESFILLFGGTRAKTSLRTLSYAPSVDCA